MMTIKEFAGLCGCNTQTLRYYDKIDLLKPVKVDQWSGYRYYIRSQAIDFVKIKNLQAADFTIDEIKVLLTKSDEQVYEAFELKVAQQEQKLERIKKIQQSYLAEKSNMEKLIQEMAGFIVSQLNDYSILREFEIDPNDGPKVVEEIRQYMEQSMRKNHHTEDDVRLKINDDLYCGAEEVAEGIGKLNGKNLSGTIIFGDEEATKLTDHAPDEYETVMERHGWEHAYEFLDDIPELDSNSEYSFVFRFEKEKHKEENGVPFSMYMLGIMSLRKCREHVTMSCSVATSSDGQNHFFMLRRK